MFVFLNSLPRFPHSPNGPSVHQMSIQKVPSREHSSLLAPSISAPEGNMTEHTTPAMHVDGFEGYATYLNGVYCEQANMFGSTNIYKLDGKVPTGYGVMSGCVGGKGGGVFFATTHSGSLTLPPPLL